MTIEYKDSKRIVALEADLTAVQGKSGGTGVASASGAGGGGGAGVAGSNGSSASAGGAGGNGLSTTIGEEKVVNIDGSYTVLKFTADGTFTPSSSFNVEYLVVGGGGGANVLWGSSGGGGAGGYKEGTGHGVTAQTYNITVGAGGADKVGTGVSSNGGNSIFDTITSLGGGGGGQYSSGAGAVGGSGGGGGDSGAGGAGTSGQGNAGGGSSASGGGGGGGAGGAGAISTGGVGLQNDITGTNLYYAGGGGGAKGSSSNAGGLGGGGTGGAGGYASTSGTDGLGGGAGAGGSLAGGNSGGSGVVIIRFLTSGNSYTITDGLGKYYAGGGAGSCDGAFISGGLGGGGKSNVNNTNNKAREGRVNSGGGGGGSRPDNLLGVSGGSGIVILEFLTSGNGYNTPTGGTATTSGDYTIIKYTSTSGTKTFTPTSSFSVDYLVVAGGGGGGSRIGGGGGAGGYRTGTKSVSAQAYTIVVGAGGAGGASQQTGVGGQGTNGSDSSFDTITATGGGGGGRYSTSVANDGSDGGSGGGGGGNASGSAGGSGTSTNIKPTNVQDNSLLVEKDTARRYWFESELAPTYEDDFTSDNSVDQDASKISVNTAQERWDFNIVNDQTNDSSSIDITTALSDTNWVMDFDYTWTSLSGTTNVNTSFFGISNSNGTVPSQTAQDHIGVRLQTGSGFSIAGCHSNNGTMQSGLSATFTTIPSVTTLYFRIVRTSTTSMTVKIYTTSARTTVSEEKTVAVSASTTGLRYVKISPYEGTNGGSNTEVGYVKNLKIYNAVTSVTPATWTMKPTYESNFTVDNWLDQDSTYIGVDTSANQLDFAVKRDSTRASSVDMLGETISETKWILRWDMVTTTHTQSAGNANNCWFGISSLPSSTAGYSAKDWLGLWIDLRQTDSASNTYAETCTAQGNHVGTKSTAFTSKAWFADNYTFGLQLQRISADSFKVSIFDSHDYDNEIESQTVTTSSSVNNLRYLGIWNANDSAFPNTYSGYTPRIRFWNNANEGDLT